MTRYLRGLLGAAVALSIVAASAAWHSALAWPQWLDDLSSTNDIVGIYPGWPYDSYGNNGCLTCHITSDPFSNGGPRNSYGVDFEASVHNYMAIEGIDSDGDGTVNGVELSMGFFPGDPAHTPPPGPPAEVTLNPDLVKLMAQLLAYPPSAGEGEVMLNPALVKQIAQFLAYLPPTGVDASDGLFEQAVKVTWQARPGANLYYVYRSTNEIPPPIPLASDIISETTATLTLDGTAALGQVYWYSVRACYQTGCSGQSVLDAGWRLTLLTPEMIELIQHIQQGSGARVAVPGALRDTAITVAPVRRPTGDVAPVMRERQPAVIVAPVVRVPPEREVVTPVERVAPVARESIERQSIERQGIERESIEIERVAPDRITR